MPISKEIESNLREKLYIISNKKWILIVSVVIIVTLTTIANFTATPLYRATARVKIEPRMPKIAPFEELYTISGRQLDYYNTQYKILKSRSLARKVMESIPAAQAAELSIPKLLQMVAIKPIAQSQLVDIKVISSDPELAMQVANTWTDQFIRMTIESKLKAIQTALSQLTTQLDEQNETVKAARRELLRYKEEERIVSYEHIQDELARVIEAYSTVKREREEKELQIQHLKKSSSQGLPLETFPQIRYHSIIMQLRSRLVQLQATLSENSQRYKSKHPTMLQLEAEIKMVKANLAEEIQKIIQGLQTEFELAKANEERLLADLEQQKTQAFNMEKKTTAIEDLEADVMIKREGQQALLSRVNETSMTKGIEITNIQIVDKAELPKTPFKPRKLFNIMLSLIVGTAGGITAIFIFENLDSSIKSAAEAKKILKLPFLGAIPQYSQLNIKINTPPLKIIRNQTGLIAEAYRTIRTAIQFSSPGNSCRVILVTSSVPQEGKSEISTQLAVVMAQGNERVLLIDSDMRKPRIGKILGLEEQREGLSNLLSGQVGIDDIVKQTAIPGLEVITSGLIPPNPSELINSSAFQELLTTTRGRWDRVILDSPPLLSVTDATILGRLADGVILVVRAGNTSGKVAIFCREKLEHVKAHLIGMILNRSDIHRGQNYYYYQTYYK